MRLDRLDLTRYGRFTDRVLTFAPPGNGTPDLHIVYGPNEAGKSTLFSAWLDLLFGIPGRTRYDFLHPGPTMQIGAGLTQEGVTLEVRRLKRNGPSLVDRHDATLPELTLQSLLGGLSRDGYSAMFSLDDETLERGGDSILASRGDLGEMLFSASAGLAGLGPQLEALRTELDGFHRNGKRSGWLYDAKKQLADLDRQRKELEVSSVALRKLNREAAAADQAWREARAREEASQSSHDRLQELAGTLPLRMQLSDLQARLAPLDHLPDATPEIRAEMARIEEHRRDLANRMRERALRVQGMEEQQAALAQDADVLALADGIDLAEALRAEHDSAAKDLPRRREEAEAALRRQHGLLVQLGQPEARPEDLCLPLARISTLRALLSARSGVQGEARTTAAETAKVESLLAREKDRLGDPGPAEDEAALTALLARLRSQDPADALARALRDRDQARGRRDAAIAALAPWSGEGDSLAALAVPPGWRIGEWEVAQEQARQQEADARRDATALRAEIDRLQVEVAGRAALQSASGVSLADAAAARSRREALWAAHLADLSTASARSFETALREDDRIATLLADTMAEVRRTALDQAAQEVATARLNEAEARLDAARTTDQRVRDEFARACAALGLAGDTLADLKPWLELRLSALAEHTALRDAETTVGRCREALEDAGRALGLALQKTAEDAPEPFEILFADATGRIAASDRRREARRLLSALTSDLAERRQAQARAEAALAEWRADWAEASRDSLLSGLSDQDSALGPVLDLLDQLGGEAQTAAALADRIDKMEANRLRFAEAKAALLAPLKLDPGTPWGDVLARLRRAQDAARDHEGLARQIGTEQQQETEDRRVLALRDAEAEAIGTGLGWSGSQGSLADHVARCAEAATLRREIDALHQELRDRPVPETGEETEDLRRKIADLKADLQILRADTETRLAEHLEARRQVESVGADDALARIAATRETLLLEIRDRTEAHLARRFGLIALEAGLRRYRDKHRSTMLTRASQAFSHLSRGAYTGLAAQPDGSHDVLVALAKAGGAKLAPEMSKGTRYQLYLALRIAGYHELAQSRPTVPFIADDIMETFDDERSAATFGLLSEMARVGQVIYLTHHRHLCDIAKSVCPDANIIDL